MERSVTLMVVVTVTLDKVKEEVMIDLVVIEMEVEMISETEALWTEVVHPVTINQLRIWIIDVMLTVMLISNVCEIE